eukprot:TRINITY_DN1122_c0_g1_i6.p1 TRINITY_DN1122_c0_g1~~TRINITY_DN1122_c0_g1_i6.p1  ORF type:complete len:183 (+),score=55.39 TRINITY_DN1122_c0_g1_i6:595-1143(+)
MYEVLRLLKETGLRLHIVSGGIRGVVMESFYILQLQKGLDLDNCLVYCMTPETYDLAAGNTLVAFGEPMIRTTNKHLYTTHETHPEIKPGNNAIVVGDIIEDAGIVGSLKLGTVLGIGFFNMPGEGNEALLQDYMNAYDIVIANDGNLMHLFEIIKFVVGMPIDAEYGKISKVAEVLNKLLC